MATSPRPSEVKCPNLKVLDLAWNALHGDAAEARALSFELGRAGHVDAYVGSLKLPATPLKKLELLLLKLVCRFLVCWTLKPPLVAHCSKLWEEASWLQ